MHVELRADTATGGGPLRPPLVYVPGIDGSGEMLLGTAERLATRFRLIRLAYRHGPLAADPDTYPRLAAGVVEVLDRLGVERALLLAESFGGAVALQTALDHAPRVAGLAIVNSFAHFGARWRLWLSCVTAPLLPPFIARLGRRLFAAPTLFGALAEPAAVAGICNRGQFELDEGYRRRLAMIRRLDLRPRLAEVTQPVTLFAADRDRIVDAVRSARRMADRLPDAELVEIRGGGHVVLPLQGLPWVDWLAQLAARCAGVEVA